MFYKVWILPDWLADILVGLSPETIFGPLKSVAATFLGCLVFLPKLFALFQMRDRFGRYRPGEIPTQASAIHVLRIGQFLMATKVAALILRTRQILLLSYDNPPRKRVLVVSISSNSIAVLLTAGPSTAIGWAPRGAARIVDESTSFV